MDLALDNLQWLMCYKTKPTKPTLPKFPTLKPHYQDTPFFGGVLPPSWEYSKPSLSPTNMVTLKIEIFNNR